ncbi:MAG TPA: flagellar assembly protein T N-terminal domain-containing protein [Syntrophales bacterium]|nr:flagellar assembly protein T N-terminal domain-containing protein [Syntrophales bacterium]
MKRTIILLVSLLVGFVSQPVALCQEKCVNAQGEAAIINNDLPSAKTEAIARAKWAAIEQTVGTEVKAGSFVQNFTLVEDVMKTQVGGVVKSYKVLDQQTKEDIVTIKISACVEPAKAREAMSSLALNNSLAVFIPARKPGKRGDVFEETNILSETLIGKLTDQNYKVVDVAPTQAVDAREIEKAVQSGSTMAVRSMMYKFLSNIIIIGKVDYTISTKKGEDIGYGLSMPFNNVTVRLTYRIVAKNNKTGAMEILTADTAQGKGLANNVEDAANEGLKDLAEKLTPKILDKVASYVQGNVKKVSIKVNGVKDLDTNMEIKNTLQNIVWVTGVEDKQMGEFIVSYPENSLYLANSIKQKGNFNIVNFSPYSLTLDYQK